MKLINERDDKEEEMDFEGTVEELLNNININAETVVVVCNGEIVTDKDRIKNTDTIKILSVVSGG